MLLPRLFVTSILMLASSLMPAQADLLAEIQKAGRIRVAIAGAVPPFNSDDATGELTGSDVDTARLLARDLGVRLDVVRIMNSERVEVLRNRRADLVISALSITPERERLIAFSVPYAHISVVIAAPKHLRLTSMLDLNDKAVGALAASSNLEHLLQHAPGARVLQYTENDKLREAYIAGEFQIMSAPASVVSQANRMKPKQALIAQFTQMEFDIAIGMPMAERALRERINNWVVARLQDHTLGDIYRKHHGLELPARLAPRRTAGKNPV